MNRRPNLEEIERIAKSHTRKGFPIFTGVLECVKVAEVGSYRDGNLSESKLKDIINYVIFHCEYRESAIPFMTVINVLFILLPGR